MLKGYGPEAFQKERAAIDIWMKDAAPSSELRKWFSHDLEKWNEFCEKYKNELDQNKDLLKMLKAKVKERNITFVYAQS